MGTGSSGAAEDIYANPPSIASTLMAAAGAGDSGISDPKLREANIGPSQIGLAAGKEGRKAETAILYQLESSPAGWMPGQLGRRSS